MILDKLKNLEIESINRGIPIIGSKKGKVLLESVEKINPKNVLPMKSIIGAKMNGSKL